MKKIKDSNLEIRNLNEFIDESETSELQMSDIDNLINVYSFFEKLMKNDKIKTDEDLLKIFKETFNKEKQIEIKLQNYLNSYGEIIQLFESYGENPEIKKIEDKKEGKKEEPKKIVTRKKEIEKKLQIKKENEEKNINNEKNETEEEDKKESEQNDEEDNKSQSKELDKSSSIYSKENNN